MNNKHPLLSILVLLMGIAFAIGAVMDFFLLTKVKKKKKWFCDNI